MFRPTGGVNRGVRHAGPISQSNSARLDQGQIRALREIEHFPWDSFVKLKN